MRFLTLLIPAAVLTAGCGKTENGPLKLQPVTGQVLYDGKPAAGVEVILMPTDAPTVPQIPRAPHAVTGPDGRFTIGTFADADGAYEGGYQIVCTWPKSAPGAEGEEEVDSSVNDRLLGWYDASHSKFSVRVQTGTNEIPALKLEKHTGPPPVSEGVPGRN